MSRVTYYRAVIKTSKQIRELLKDKANNLDEIIKLREELVELFKGWVR